MIVCGTSVFLMVCLMGMTACIGALIGTLATYLVMSGKRG